MPSVGITAVVIEKIAVDGLSSGFPR